MNCAFASVLGGGIAATTMAVLTPSAETKPAGPGAAMSSHYALLAMSREDLSTVDVAMMNLLCARALPGAERLDQCGVLRKLDKWAGQVRSETERHLYRISDPRYAEHYGHSEARLRAEFLVQVLRGKGDAANPVRPVSCQRGYRGGGDHELGRSFAGRS
ncbi:MAG: hypothetical protein GXY55_16330 [Phycisphaerae bacterium]|nr:hypothetical protein [Phycisphaerae bacterium]